MARLDHLDDALSAALSGPGRAAPTPLAHPWLTLVSLTMGGTAAAAWILLIDGLGGAGVTLCVAVSATVLWLTFVIGTTVHDRQRGSQGSS